LTSKVGKRKASTTLSIRGEKVDFLVVLRELEDKKTSLELLNSRLARCIKFYAKLYFNEL